MDRSRCAPFPQSARLHLDRRYARDIGESAAPVRSFRLQYLALRLFHFRATIRFHASPELHLRRFIFQRPCDDRGCVAFDRNISSGFFVSFNSFTFVGPVWSCIAADDAESIWAKGRTESKWRRCSGVCAELLSNSVCYVNNNISPARLPNRRLGNSEPK